MQIEEIYAITPDADGWRILREGNHVRLGSDVKLSTAVTLGDWVKLGDGVTLGDGVRLGDGVSYESTPTQVQCHPYIVYPYSLSRIGVGCVVHDLEYWRRGEPAELANHPECRPWDRYMAAIELVAAWIESQPALIEERKAEDAIAGRDAQETGADRCPPRE